MLYCIVLYVMWCPFFLRKRKQNRARDKELQLKRDALEAETKLKKDALEVELKRIALQEQQMNLQLELMKALIKKGP